VSDLAAQRAQRVVDDFLFVRTEENDVAVLRAGSFDDGAQRRLMEILHDRRLQAGFIRLRDVVDLDVSQALRAVDADKLGVFVDLAARERTTARHAQRRHAAISELATPANTLNATSFTASVTSVSSSVTRKSGLSEP